MKNSILRIFFFLVFSGFMSSCQSQHELVLKSPSDKPVYTISVSDGSEIDLLKQQLQLDIIKVKDSTVYFHAPDQNILKQLSDMGYRHTDRQSPDNIYMLYGKVTDKFTEPEILNSGVLIINREKDNVIVYGTISNLKKLKEKGYRIMKPEAEPRPREIEVKITRRNDIQRIYDMGVDIFSATPGKDSSFIIRGSAFDLQIDSIKKMNYPVQIIKSKI